MKKYYITTYGCQLNEHESEKIAGMSQTMGYEKADCIEDADLIVFNTCAIRENAENKVLGNVGKLKALKKEHPEKIIVVCGCMTQIKSSAEKLLKNSPFVDIVLGTHNLHHFKEYIEEFEANRKRLVAIWDKENEEDCETETVNNSEIEANVNIMYGCNNFCTYCIVPYTRGRERSRAFDEIVCEVKELISRGYKIITLLGQNVNSYAYDFPKLLDTLANLEGDFLIKFMTSHPKDCSDELIEVVRKNEKISKSIHLPFQSGSNKILKAMNRKYTREDYLSLIDRVRVIPDLSLSTDIIIGFPGETEEDYLETIDMIKRVKYGTVFAFVYSKRTGTPASKMFDDTPESLKKQRLTDLFKVQKEIMKEMDKTFVGRDFRVFVRDEDTVEMDNGKQITVKNMDKDFVHTFKRVKITKVVGTKFYGELV